MEKESEDIRRERLARLTRRERETLLLRVEGLFQREIAEQMHIGTDTVKKHLHSTYEKLEIRHLESQVQRFAALQQYGELLRSSDLGAESPVSARDEETVSAADGEADVEKGANQGFPPGMTLPDEESSADRPGAGDANLTERLGHLETSFLVFEDEYERKEANQYALQLKGVPFRGGMEVLDAESEEGTTSRGAARRRMWMAFAVVALISVAFGALGTAATLMWWSASQEPAGVVNGRVEPGEMAHGEAADGFAATVTGTAEESGEQRSGDTGTGGTDAGGTDAGGTDAGVEDAGETETAGVEEATAYVSGCGEDAPLAEQVNFELDREFGVIRYDADTTEGVFASDRVRTLTIDERGLWLGFFGEGEEAGLMHFDRQRWMRCPIPAADLNVNHVAVDGAGRVWAALEQAGIAYFDGEAWHTFDISSGLSSNSTYHVLPEADGRVWVQTWEGINLYQNGAWRTPYTQRNGTLFNNRVHAIAFDGDDTIWVGHIGQGISRFDNESGTWMHHTVDNSGLGGNEVRALLVREDGEFDGEDEVWVATADGGVSRFAGGEWSVFGEADGLPHTTVQGLAVDKFGRVWAATAGGVAYYDGERWQLYHDYPAFAVAFGPACSGCPINDDQVWVATMEAGITYSRIPLPPPVVDVIEVRYPEVVRPGEQFRPEIVIAPRAPYQFRPDRGDALYFASHDDELRFGAWLHMPVLELVEAGEPYVFSDYENLFTAPLLEDGVDSATFTSPWRMWMYTRYVGPPVEITFTVERAPDE